MPALQVRDFTSKFLQKRFPTILGLILLMLGVGAGVVLVRGGTGGFLPRASEDTVPKQIRITNISDTGFTVSFLTTLVAPGYIQYGTQENRTSIQTRDDRDQLTNQVGSFQTHHITVRGLQPNTQYYFRIGTGSNSMFDNGGKAFAVKTASRIENLPAAKTAYGTVKNDVGNAAAGSIVYLSIDGASPLSSTVKTDGSWAIPLAGLRTNDLSGAHSLADTTPVKVQVQGEAANVTANVDVTIANLAPLEAVTLSKGGTTKTSASPAASPLSSPLATAAPTGSPSAGLGSLFTPNEASQADNSADVELRFPLREGEVVTSVKPELSGEAPPNSYLQIEIHSDPVYNGVVQTDAQGNWDWTPPGNLTPGEHTVIVTYTDAAGQQQKVQRKFIVQATGSNLPSFVSTPSAVVAPTPAPRSTPSPTPVATVRPTATPLPTVAATPYIPATTSAQPVSGSPRPMVGLFTIAIAFLSFGIWRMQYGRSR